MPKYKITSIYYTKPAMTRDANGEAVFFRFGVNLTVGLHADYDKNGAKVIASIDFNEKERQFYIHFVGGGLKTVQWQNDTEVTYKEVKDN